MNMIEFYHRRQAIILGFVSFATIVITWQLVVDFGLVNAFFISTPGAVWKELFVQAGDGSLLKNTLATLYGFALALGMAVVVGVGLGMVAGWFRDVEAALDPFIWFKYSTPTVAFYPLFVAWLGYGLPTIVAISFLFALTPIYANTLSGIKNVDRDLKRAATSFGATPLDIFLRIALPGSIPVIVAGLRLGVGRALTGVVVAELFGANAGLGYAIAFYAQKLQTTRMMIPIVAVVLIGVLLTQILSYIEQRSDVWRVSHDA